MEMGDSSLDTTLVWRNETAFGRCLAPLTPNPLPPFDVADQVAYYVSVQR
jgi:hypothetical protein